MLIPRQETSIKTIYKKKKKGLKFKIVNFRDQTQNYPKHWNLQFSVAFRQRARKKKVSRQKRTTAARLNHCILLCSLQFIKSWIKKYVLVLPIILHKQVTLRGSSIGPVLDVLPNSH